MANTSEAPGSAPAPVSPERELLARRLADIVCLPASRITPQERHIAADLLIDVLRESPVEFRERCARRIAELPEAPASVLRWLAIDDVRVAQHVISRSEAMKDADLSAVARAGAREHRRLVATRREVSALLSEALAERDEPDVMAALLANPGATLSEEALDRMVRAARDALELSRPLARRRELKPAQGLTLFWWSDPPTRKHLLLRFGVERRLLQDAAADIYAMAAASSWSDPVTRKALQFIERRQRNRAALARSPYESLEKAIEAMAAQGVDRRIVEEVSFLSGVKPATGVKILSDPGGEPIAVLCKATGLKRASFDLLWTALKRPISTEDRSEAMYEHVVDVYESLANDKAQTVLRYWNWALTSALAPALAAAAAADDDAMFRDDRLSAAERAARLIWGAGLGPTLPKS